MNIKMRLHHVGIVVESLASYGEMCAGTLGLKADSTIFYDDLQKVRLQFWKAENGSLLELIEPVGEDSPALGALKKGGGLNHLCFEVENIDEQVRISEQQGAIRVSAIVPAVAFSGRRIVFMFFPKLNLLEFVETDRS